MLARASCLKLLVKPATHAHNKPNSMQAAKLPVSRKRNSARGCLQAPHLEQPVKQRLVLSLEYVWQKVVFGQHEVIV